MILFLLGLLSLPKSISTPTPVATSLAFYDSGEPNGRPLKTSEGHRPMVSWACFELGLDLTFGDWRKNPSPLRQLPCLTEDAHNNVAVFESSAIMQYLLVNYGQNAIAAEKDEEADKASISPLTPAQVASIMGWIGWAHTSLDEVCFVKRSDGLTVYRTRLDEYPLPAMDRLDAVLLAQEEGVYLVPGIGFSLADVVVASYLLQTLDRFGKCTINLQNFDDSWPNVSRYLQRCMSRPGFAHSFSSGLKLHDKFSKLDKRS
jgi:glutathione S-transferase